MNYATTSQAPVPPQDRQAFEAFAAGLRSPAFWPGDDGYDEACRIWNGKIERRPALVVRPRDQGEVAGCIRFARDGGLPLSIRGGGHNIAGTALCDGGLMLDFSTDRRVKVDPATRRVRVRPGATWGRGQDHHRPSEGHHVAAFGGAVHAPGRRRRTPSAAETAVGSRTAEYVLNMQGAWEQPAEDDIHIAWARDFWSAMRPFSSGGTSVNFLTEDADEERLRAAYGADLYARLARIKAKYDPDNLIRSNEPEHPARARRLSRRALGNRSYRVARRCYAETARPRREKACGRPLPHRLCLRAPVDIGRRFLIS